MTPPFRLTLALLTLGFALSACATVEKTAPEQAPAAAAPAKLTRAQNAQNAQDAIARLPRVTMQPPERAMRDGLNGPDAPGPERLVGLDAAAIQKMLGIPDFKRRDPPAEIWQYRNDGCLLDVFLYLNAGGYSVTHVEVRGRSVAEVSGTECLLEALAH